MTYKKFALLVDYFLFFYFISLFITVLFSKYFTESCGGPAISLRHTSGSTIFFPSRGSAVCVPGMHKVTMELGFSCLQCLATVVTLTWLITGLALGSVPTMGKASWDHTLPSRVPFHSLQVLLLLATQGLVRAPVKLLGGSPVEALQFHCIHTQFHWSSGPPVCFPSWETRVQSPGGYLCEIGILLLALSHYIGDPDMTNHCGIVWGGVCPELSLDRCADNIDNPTWSNTAHLSRFHTRCRSSFWLHNRHKQLLGGALWRACNLTGFTHSSTGPVVHPFASRHGGPSHWSSGSTIFFLSRGSAVHVPGMQKLTMEPGFSC